MNLSAETLLSDGFAEFSGKIVALHEKKKELKDEFKKVYEDHKLAIKALDEEAETLQNTFLQHKDSSEAKTK